jgi:hypothetical protein
VKLTNGTGAVGCRSEIMTKISSSNALDGFANICAYDRRQNFPPEFAGAQRT